MVLPRLLAFPDCYRGRPVLEVLRLPERVMSRTGMLRDQAARAAEKAAKSAKAAIEKRQGFHADIPEEQYHADRGSLSVSGAKVILKAPALFKWQLDHKPYKAEWDFGHAAHALVLGVGMETETYDAPDWRTKAVQQWRDEVRAAGKTPLLLKDYTRVSDMADALSSHTLAMQLLSEGEPEVSAYALDETTGVMRRGRFDWLGATILTDYKTCVSANPRDLAGRYGVISKWGYDQQIAWYLDLARDLDHPAQAFCLIFQEKEPPYLVTVVEVSEDELHQARRDNRRALEMFRDCTESGLWPGYTRSDGYVMVSLDQQDFEERSL